MSVGIESAALCDTSFAPAGRDAPETLARKQEIVERSPLLRETLNAIQDVVLILNEQRQIVAANNAAFEMLKTTMADLAAKRPGEAVGCAWSKLGPDGCGTERHCVACGAVNAILESQQKNAHIVKECRIQVDGPDGPASLDLRVAATPITIEGERLVVLAIEDISKSKRLEVLQRVFFHDVLNSAACISGYASCLMDQGQSIDEMSDWLVRLSDDLVEEIKAQRDLLMAESGDLSLRITMVPVLPLLEDLCVAYGRHLVAVDRHVKISKSWDGSVETDRRLLLRVLGNMIKNGLEATAPGETVTVGCCDQEKDVQFTVHNPEVMPEDVQLQIFQRSFSTKGQPGRGVGTYSMKLLGEQYLNGKVGFFSNSPDGTTFSLSLPKRRA